MHIAFCRLVVSDYLLLLLFYLLVLFYLYWIGLVYIGMGYIVDPILLSQQRHLLCDAWQFKFVNWCGFVSESMRKKETAHAAPPFYLVHMVAIKFLLRESTATCLDDMSSSYITAMGSIDVSIHIIQCLLFCITVMLK